MSIRIADAITEELTPQMREVFDRADLLLELEARYLAQHLTRTQLAGLYGHERAVGDVRDVAVVLRACQIADAPLLGPEWPSLFLRRAAELREQLALTTRPTDREAHLVSTHPAYDPDPQADGVRAPLSETGRGQVRALIDSVVQTAAPRLGKVAVARIAKPLAEALSALHEHQRDEANGWRAVGEALDATNPSDASSVLLRARHVMAMLNVLDKPESPVAVAEVDEVVGAIDAQDPRRVPVRSIVAEQRSIGPSRIGTRTGPAEVGFQWAGEQGYRSPSADVRMISVGGTP